MTKQSLNTLSYPTRLPLPPTTLLPSTHPIVKRTISRLTRPALLSLVHDWLSDVNQFATSPFLCEFPDDKSNDLFPPASSLKQLREIYTGLGTRNGTKRDVLDRILEGDWRHGVSLYALAMADMQFLYSHPLSQKWSAWEITPVSQSSSILESTIQDVPRFHPATFLRNMQQECLPDVKVHYNIDRHSTLPLLILRVWILESPYRTSFALTNATVRCMNNSRLFYIAFPDFSPYIYISLTNNLSDTSCSSVTKAGNSKSLRKLILEAIPKAFSKPRERYTLRSTNLSARNLEALVEYRGNGRTNTVGGGWSSYAEVNSDEAIKDNPLNTRLPSSLGFAHESMVDEFDRSTARNKVEARNLKHKIHTDETEAVERRKKVAQSRFGRSALADDGKGIDRLFVRIEDPFPQIPAHLNDPDSPRELSIHHKIDASKGIEKCSNSQYTSPNNNACNDFRKETEVCRLNVLLTFTGTHIFAGIRELVENGVIDGLRMPGWMTGEHGFSHGVIINGRIQDLHID